MPMQGVQHRPLLHVPQEHRIPVISASQQRAVWTKGHRPDRLAVVSNPATSTLAHVPHAHRLVPASAGNTCPIWTPGDAHDGAVVSLQETQADLSLRV